MFIACFVLDTICKFHSEENKLSKNLKILWCFFSGAVTACGLIQILHLS